MPGSRWPSEVQRLQPLGMVGSIAQVPAQREAKICNARTVTFKSGATCFFVAIGPRGQIFFFFGGGGGGGGGGLSRTE